MKRTYLTVIVALAVLVGAYGTAGAYTSPGPPHTDYRVFSTTGNLSGYVSGCASNGVACHQVSKDKFLPADIDQSAATNFTNFCLSCHNAAGEAHDRKVGSPSTNAYVNKTGFNPDGGYKGDSHSWRGTDGNAGTRTNTLLGGTAHMPNGDLVTCQVCHEGMGKITEEENIHWESTTDQSDHKNYKLANHNTTRQHLAKYIRVYRSASAVVTEPATRAKKLTYMVKPSEYTYDPMTAMVTFSVSQGVNKIYVDIPAPYFRASNQSNRVCLDCHFDRASSQATHEPGTGAKNNHPVMVKYGNVLGLSSTVKLTPNSNIYLDYTAGVGNRVLCTSCHDPHNAASKDGQILRKEGSELCGDCHKVSYTGYTGLLANHNGAAHTANSEPATVCLDCHTTHGTKNIMLIRNVINGKQINFQNLSGADSFGMDTGNSVCEACHANTSYHKSDGTGTGHNTANRCTKCHTHQTGFNAGGTCLSCHGTTGTEVDDYTYGNGTKALINTDEYSNAGHGRTTAYPYTHNAGANLACTACHTGSVGHGNSANPFRLSNPDTVALCNGCHATLGNHDFAHVGGSGTWTWQPKCVDCHDPHGDKGGITTSQYNGAMIQGNMAYTGSDTYGVPSAVDAVDFPSNYARAQGGNFLNWSSFVNNDATNRGVCRDCHTQATTDNFTRTLYTNHNSGGGACTTCHSHSEGFKPSGGACDSCHGFPPSPTKAGPSGWADADGGRHAAHMGYILSKFSLSGNAACGTCHGATIPRGDHKTLSTAGMDTTHQPYWGSGTFNNGGTAGTANTGDDFCTNVACHSLGGTRYWGGTTRTCGSCHEFPTTSNDWSGDNGHTIRQDGITNVHMPATGYVTDANTDGTLATNYAAATNQTTGPCGKCHGGGTHMNSTVDVNANGYAACNTLNYPNFTITKNGAMDVTCTNVACHGANKTTPNWW